MFKPVSNKSRPRHWEQIYRSKAEDQVSWFEPMPETSLRLISDTGAPPSSAVVDIGAGTSRLVDALLARGFRDVTALDVSERALRQLRKRLGAKRRHVTFIAADVTAWTPERLYDVWHDRAVLHFLTEPLDREGYLGALTKGLKVGGHLIVGTFAATGPERCSGLPVMRYSAQALMDLFGLRFSLEDAFEEDHRTPGGAIQRFQFARFTRNA